MSKIQLPEFMMVQLVYQRPFGLENLEFAGVAFEVCLFNKKNNYHLGPFFSDDKGQVHITYDSCQSFVQASHSSGLMDYPGLTNCDPWVEIRHLAGWEIKYALENRQNTWNLLLEGEKQLFKSVDELLTLYKSAINDVLPPPAEPLRVCWDGRMLEPVYHYYIFPK